MRLFLRGLSLGLWAVAAMIASASGAMAFAELQHKDIGAQTQFKDKPVKLVMPDATGKPHIGELHALLAREAATETRVG